ncbi:UDP-glucose 6-dehydrogenase [Solibacillus ferritrahens]|uniref:UDP-glucose 6-dehydrogenase n=1 Tax=Solibacillus ferritrahens TaxID=3098620 RepID=UPI00300B3D4D
MLQLTFNRGGILTFIEGDEEILSIIPYDYKYYDAFDIESSSISTEHLIDSYAYALKNDGVSKVNKAAYYAKLRGMYIQKMGNKK